MTISDMPSLTRQESIKQPDPAKDAYNNKLRKACSEFESLFIYYMLKTMRSSTVKCAWLHQDRTEDIHTSLFDQEVSSHLAKQGGIGIGEMLYRQLDPETHGVQRLHTYNNSLKLKKGQADTTR